MVYLVLAAQYESWLLPAAVILVVPLALLGTVIAVAVRGMDEGSIRDFTPPFTEEERKLIVQRLPHGETLTKSLFLLRNFLLAEFRKGNTIVSAW